MRKQNNGEGGRREDGQEGKGSMHLRAEGRKAPLLHCPWRIAGRSRNASRCLSGHGRSGKILTLRGSISTESWDFGLQLPPVVLPVRPRGLFFTGDGLRRRGREWVGVSEMDGLKCELIILGISYQRWGGRAEPSSPLREEGCGGGGVYRAHHNKWSVRPSDWARNATVRGDRSSYDRNSYNIQDFANGK